MDSEDRRYPFPLGIQLGMPQDLHGEEFATLLDLLRRLRFACVELNIVDLDRHRPEEYREVLERHDLRLSMIATGAFAKRHGLSLSAADPAKRGEATAWLEQAIRFAGELGAGVICGFIKGPPGGDRAACQDAMRRSLDTLSPIVRRHGVPLLLEATNHNEATLANTLSETAELVAGHDNPFFRILPDTYHMNIAEANAVHALCRHRNLYRSIHISDNNRRFPGLGGLDFFPILAALKGIGFDGVMAVEGMSSPDIAADIRATSDYLAGVSRRLELLD